MRLAIAQCEPPTSANDAAARDACVADDVLRERMGLLGQLAGDAAAAGADLLLFPEAFLSGYHIGPEASRQRALGQDSPVLEQIAVVARSNHLAIAFGYLGWSKPPTHNLYNMAAIISAGGELVLRYKKAHLFGDTDRSRFVPGSSPSAIIHLNGVAIALAICYDIEFPELARCLALRGAQLILVPTANMAPYDSVALRIIPTRAEENGLFVAYANYTGREQEFQYTGLSCVCGPDGNDIVRAQNDAALLFADIDVRAIDRVRAAVNYLEDRRIDIDW
ncbi:MAG: nitrilase-related carbon-nitrogen hydrolase [Burkholderiaceae bacterium]